VKKIFKRERERERERERTFNNQASIRTLVTLHRTHGGQADFREEEPS
jgi:hypothetical protein